MLKKLISILSAIVIITIGVIINEKNKQRHIYEILESPAYSNGVFNELKYEKGKTLLGVYTFEVDGIQIESSKGIGKYEKIWHALKNKTFPVIYNVTDPKKNEILVFPSDFLKYKLNYPDSLNWVKREQELMGQGKTYEEAQNKY